MSKTGLVVELQIVAGMRDAFVERVSRHGETCLAEEEGCLRFDVLVPQDNGNRVFLYELYADQAALDVHDGTERMARYRADTKDMLATRTRTVCTLVND